MRTYGDPKDLEVNLPAGVIVDPRASEMRCTEAELESPEGPGSCPNGAAVGVFSVDLDGVEVIDEPVYNMVAPAGVPSELGFDAAGIGLIMHVGGRLRTGGDYGLSGEISGIPDEHPIYGLQLTLWGDPSAASHDEERGLCADDEAKQIFEETGIHSSCPVELSTKPFLTLPTFCTSEPLTTTQQGLVAATRNPEPGWDSRPERSTLADGEHVLAAVDGLRKPPLQPEADGERGPTASRERRIAQRAERRSEAAARRKRKRCGGSGPEGSIRDVARGDAPFSPSAAGGREACTPEEIELDNAKAPTCPEAARPGTAKIETPLLEHPPKAPLYLAQQGANPFNSLLALYLVAEGGGMLIKLAGEVQANLKRAG